MTCPVLESSQPKSVTLFCDGASRGNPGPGAYGFVLFENETLIYEQGQTLGHVTNNVAEYQGLIAGLKKCLEIGVAELIVKSDSELMVRQLNGSYKVKSPLILPLYGEAKTLLRQFRKVNVSHVRREENKLADAAANRALDAAVSD